MWGARRAAILQVMDKSLAEKVLESTDIVELIGEVVALRRRGKEHVGLCPFHDDHTPSLNVSPGKQIFKCFSCGAGGDALRFVQLYRRVEFREALRILAERAGIEFGEAGADSARASALRELRAVLEWAREHFERNLASKAGRAALEYALGRGLSREAISRFRLGYAPDRWDDLLAAGRRAGLREAMLVRAGLVISSENEKTYDRFRNRLMFPICDRAGRCVGFGGRTLGNDPAKYLNSPENDLFQKSRVLFGLDQARSAISRKREALVVEGYLDAILLHQFGFDNAVATLGTALTDGHVRSLRGLADSIVLCFDSDEAGQRAADRALETALRSGVTVRVVIMSEGKDPAECLLAAGADGFTAHLHSALDALEFKWQSTVRACGGSDAFARRSAALEFVRYVARLGSFGGMEPLAQGVLASRLSELLSLPARSVYDLLAGARAAQERGAPSEAPDNSEASAYGVETRGLPLGLVAAVEGLFGAALAAPQFWPQAAELLAAAGEEGGAWRRLYGVLERLSTERGVWSPDEVLAECEDDAAAGELVRRACAAHEGCSVDAGVVSSLCQRVQDELELLRMADLRSRLRSMESSGADREQAYRALLRAGRGRHDVLGAEQRQFPAAGGRVQTN